MTNEEFYKDELKVIMKRVTKDLLIDQIAVNKQGQPKCCITQSCDDCIFNGHCTLVAKRQWLEKEYVEPEQQISMKPVFVHPLQFDNWILCNERLPETFEPEAKAYLTTNENGMIGVSYYHPMCGWSNGYESVFDVIAWQPLPEPYREEQEDE